MAEKRKASDDASGASPSPPLARMRVGSTDDEDVSHGGGFGSGGERRRMEVVPPPPPQPMAGTDSNLKDNSGRIDSFGRDVDEEGSSPSGKGEELTSAAGQPQPLPNDERSVIAAATPGPATTTMVATEYIWCSGCLSQTASVRLVPEVHVCHCVHCHFSPSGTPYCEFYDGAHP